MIPVRNPTTAEVKAMIAESEHKAAKWLKDTSTGDIYYWPAEIYQHMAVAYALKINDYTKGLAVDD
jgi:hypothetical protein